jgi:hypothetical protein
VPVSRFNSLNAGPFKSIRTERKCNHAFYFRHTDDKDFDQDYKETTSEVRLANKLPSIGLSNESGSNEYLINSHFDCLESFSVKKELSRHSKIDFLNLDITARQHRKEELIGSGI